jgi:hypothetical protein
MAREAEAIRERRARVTKAEGETEAAAKLVEAAKQFGSQPGAIELRRLQTMAEVGAEPGVRVNTAHPGYMPPMRRNLTPGGVRRYTRRRVDRGGPE